jgi:hypothetical protein
VSGGYDNTAKGDQSTVSGGQGNTASGYSATVSGGYGNTASGKESFAAGSGAQALHQGAFVWADSQGSAFASTANDQFCIRAQGGVQLDPTTSLFFGQAERQMLNLYGTSYAIGVQDLTLFNRGDGDFAWYEHGAYTNVVDNPGSGGTLLMLLNGSGDLTMKRNVNAVSFNPSSDRNLKENFRAISPQEVLDKVNALPITKWNFKEETVPHIGPMAQDFYAAFSLGMDDKHIATVDESGVALAAIQGLNQKLDEKDAEIQKLQEKAGQVDSLEKRLSDLEKIVQSLSVKK